MSVTDWLVSFILALLLSCNVMVYSTTDPGDLAVIEEFRKGLENPELLKWPDNGDPCGPPQWPHVFCSGSRIGQIQVQGMGLKGTLPQDLNKLSMLSNVGLQKNGFTGKLPTFKGLSKLQYVYLDYNSFDSIPSDFFDGLTRLQVISLDSNPFNQTTGWVLPESLTDSAQLVNFSCSSCNLVGPVPDFLGKMASMTSLRLSGNNLTGELPLSFGGSNVQILHLNDQTGDGLNGSIAVLSSMVSLTELWLHGNSLSGVIPSNISSCVSLMDLSLHNNKLTGIIPQSMGTMMQLQKLQLDHNKFIGPIPKLGIPTYSYDENSFCELKPGIPCAPEVSDLLDFLGGINYPLDLVGSWSGNSPCSSTWLGISCTSNKVSVINLQNRELTGFISPSLGKLDALVNILLGGNILSGTIPANLIALKSLKTLNLTSNNLEPPVPRFREDVVLHIDDNPSLGTPSAPKPPGGGNQSATPGAPPSTTPPTPGAPGSISPPTSNPPPGAPPSTTPPTPSSGSVPQPPSPSVVVPLKGSKAIKILAISSSVIVGALAVAAAIICLCRQRKRMVGVKSPSSTIVHPKDLSDPKNELKIPVKDSPYRSVSVSDLLHSEKNDTHMVDSANQMISVHILRDVTQNFAPENELGRGGFGIVYKGQLHDGTMIAVKRMEATVISNKAFNEFDSEIAVLSKLRHRNLVSLLGYSMGDNERILVYEYMPQGALSKHLFQWKSLGFDPLTWKRRLNIALDVARGMEYLHSLAHQSFIHRDLKPSNILLGDDFRAKVSDFGLVKLSPDGKNSFVTTLAGTFGYLAPEYAVTGKITTKVDVYSFGVVLMELLTGLKALDEDRPDETRYLASWFCNIKSDKDNLMAAIDTSITMTDDTFESISIIAELAGHCAASAAQQRPDMGHAVSVLSQLVEKWKPMKDESENYMGIDLRQPLSQMVEGWQAGMDSDISLISLDDSKGSIPARPNGFAESFTSTDGR